MPITVTGLYIYPVKSLRGISLQRAELTPQGLRYNGFRDRGWMIVNAKGGFLTQRQFPQQALIHTHLTDDALVLRRDGMEELLIPHDYAGPGTVIEAEVWRDTCTTLDEGDAAASWLQQAIGWDKPVRLVRMAPEVQRPQSNPELLGENTHTHFADAAPYLVANENSLSALNKALADKGLNTVPMNRFRPNIVTDGLEAFAEHQLKTLTHSDYQLQFCYPCERCIMTTIDQDTAEKHPAMEPFKTLVALNPMPEKKQAPAFAENGILTRGSGTNIQVGDCLEQN